MSEIQASKVCGFLLKFQSLQYVELWHEPCDTNPVRKPPDKIKNDIRALYGDPLKKPSNVAKEYPTLYLKARRVFGSWKKGLEACGVDYEQSRNRKKWSREKVLREIKNVYSSGHSLRPKDFRRKGLVNLVSAATYHFGSWRKAVESSGICYSCGRAKKGKQSKGSTLRGNKQISRSLEATHRTKPVSG